MGVFSMANNVGYSIISKNGEHSNAIRMVDVHVLLNSPLANDARNVYERKGSTAVLKFPCAGSWKATQGLASDSPPGTGVLVGTGCRSTLLAD
jgi:hypothetical protein